jgi:hypothetical protein
VLGAYWTRQSNLIDQDRCHLLLEQLRLYTYRKRLIQRKISLHSWPCCVRVGGQPRVQTCPKTTCLGCLSSRRASSPSSKHASDDKANCSLDLHFLLIKPFCCYWDSFVASIQPHHLQSAAFTAQRHSNTSFSVYFLLLGAALAGACYVKLLPVCARSAGYKVLDVRCSAVRCFCRVSAHRIILFYRQSHSRRIYLNHDSRLFVYLPNVHMFCRKFSRYFRV